MTKQLLIGSSICFAVSSVFVTGLVFAGGGPVAFTVEPSSSLNPGEQYVVHAIVYADGPYPTYCRNCFIKLAFQNPQDSDYIAQDRERTDDEGRIYAKVISKVPGNRVLYVSELNSSDGTKIVANSTVILNYTENPIPPTPTVTPLPSPTPTLIPTATPLSDYFPKELSIKILGQTSVQSEKGLFRSVLLEWNGSPGSNVRYFIFARSGEDAPLGEAGWATMDTAFTGPTGSMILAASTEWYIKVKACKLTNPNDCIVSPSVLLTKYNQKQERVQDKSTVIEIETTPITKLYPNKTIANGQKVAELEEKVNSLQNQVAQTQARQSALEQLVNTLLSIFRNLFKL